MVKEPTFDLADWEIALDYALDTMPHTPRVFPGEDVTQFGEGPTPWAVFSVHHRWRPYAKSTARRVPHGNANNITADPAEVYDVEVFRLACRLLGVPVRDVVHLYLLRRES